MALRLQRRRAGFYETSDHRWAIIRTEWDGPRGGRLYLWELAESDCHQPGGWVVGAGRSGLTLREAREYLARLVGS